MVPDGTNTKTSIDWDDMDLYKFGMFGSLYILATDLLLYPSDLITTRLQYDSVRFPLVTYSTTTVRFESMASYPIFFAEREPAVCIAALARWP